MRHLTERLVQPLFCILDEYEAGLRSKPKRTLQDEKKIWWVSMIKHKLSKRYE